jgi:D-tyrosyl-tRNA(Tyr) deacylase
MRVLLQRVTSAHVAIAGERIGEIGHGLLALVGVAATDSLADIAWCADKVVGLRIFADEAGRMNRSVVEVGGAVLSVSQFTLCADVSRGRRPGFTRAAGPELADPYWRQFNELVAASGVTVATGRFGADMAVSLVNDGPVTIWLDSHDRTAP